MRTGRPAVPKVRVTCANPECGNEWDKQPADVARNKTGRFFCSKPCQHAVGTRPRSKDNVTCEECGAEFYPRLIANANRFCSAACHNKHQTGDRAPRSCRRCGTTFTARPSDPDVYCSRQCYDIDRQTPVGTRKRTSDGYALVYAPGTPGAHATGWINEHRYVMQEHLGRPLKHYEEVHHRNAVRDDNRINNLELWNTSHPAGARIEDVVVWAKEMLALYDPDALA